ncbi:MAG TPA: hypothetical protein VKE94_11985, partial [Gemmataceae bacterium]|nr:hypothetical protein [Gemmataceae bacterium]
SILAGRLRHEAGDDLAAQVQLGFRLAFCRPPSDDEIAAAVRLVREHGLPALCRALFNASEFVYLY